MKEASNIVLDSGMTDSKPVVLGMECAKSE